MATLPCGWQPPPRRTLRRMTLWRILVLGVFLGCAFFGPLVASVVR